MAADERGIASLEWELESDAQGEVSFFLCPQELSY